VSTGRAHSFQIFLGNFLCLPNLYESF
jgi:hypothetical protein